MNAKRLLIFCCLICSMNNVQGQNIELVNKLSGNEAGFRMRESIQFANKMYFSTASDERAILWVTDGTSVGTVKIYECPNAYGAYAFNKLYVFNNQLFFTGVDSAHGRELWTSDGSSTGTHMVKDINSGKESSFNDRSGTSGYFGTTQAFTPMAVMNGKFYFEAADSQNRFNYFESDGTEAGTRKLTPFSTYPAFGVGDVATINGHLLLQASWSQFNFGLYTSDGSPGSATLLSDKTFITDCFSYKSGLLFNGRDSLKGAGLCITDGTQAGTNFIGPGLKITVDNTTLNGLLYFFGGSSLCTTDGTLAGTSIIKSGIAPPFVASTSPEIHQYFPVAYNNSIYFCGRYALWKSDGTSSGTSIVKTFPDDSINYLPALPSGLMAAGGRLYLRSMDSLRAELYVSDGTADGTHKVSYPGANYHNFQSYPTTVEPMFVLNNQLFFTATYDTLVGKALYKVSLPTSVSNAPNTAAASLIIAPNPTPGAVNIRYPKGVYTTADVYDAIGRTVYTQAASATGQDVLNLTHLPPGNYFIRLSGSAPTISAPVRIER